MQLYIYRLPGYGHSGGRVIEVVCFDYDCQQYLTLSMSYAIPAANTADVPSQLSTVPIIDPFSTSPFPPCQLLNDLSDYKIRTLRVTVWDGMTVRDDKI